MTTPGIHSEGRDAIKMFEFRYCISIERQLLEKGVGLQLFSVAPGIVKHMHATAMNSSMDFSVRILNV